jgi:hypothetical protein
MGRRVKRPEVGDRIRHDTPHLDLVREGVVDLLLSAQFVYVTDEGVREMCLFTEIWEVIDE